MNRENSKLGLKDNLHLRQYVLAFSDPESRIHTSTCPPLVNGDYIEKNEIKNE